METPNGGTPEADDKRLLLDEFDEKLAAFQALRTDDTGSIWARIRSDLSGLLVSWLTGLG